MNKILIVSVSLAFLLLSYFLTKYLQLSSSTNPKLFNNENQITLEIPDAPSCKLIEKSKPFITNNIKNQNKCYFNSTELTIPPPEERPAWSYQQLYSYFEAYDFQEDGLYYPKDCEPSSINAIIVCYRDRDQHLRYFLEHTIKTLIRQNSAFKIYLVEPLQNTTFNRAKLFNVGFVEAMKDKGENFYNCVTFHDVDLIQMSKN